MQALIEGEEIDEGQVDAVEKVVDALYRVLPYLEDFHQPFKDADGEVTWKPAGYKPDALPNLIKLVKAAIDAVEGP